MDTTNRLKLNESKIPSSAKKSAKVDLSTTSQDGDVDTSSLSVMMREFSDIKQMLQSLIESQQKLQENITGIEKRVTGTEDRISKLEDNVFRLENQGHVIMIPASAPAKKDDDEDWVKLPNKCEVCKYVTVEMKSAFEETGKKQEKPKNDIRFIEVMETICQRLMHYNLHKERTGSNRFAKCYVMMEKYEDVIEDWYRKHQDEDLTTYLCEKHVLKGENQGCLDEVWTSKKGETAAIDEKKKKKKKGTNNDKENNKKKSKGRKRRRVTWRLREGTEQRILHLTKTSRKRSPSPMIKVIYERDARIQCAVDWLLNTVPGKMCTAFHNGMKTT